MLNKVKQRKQEGFTIIEVLIVLAIAGLIMLVVFMAVPALQRNSRNTQRKSDVSSILGGYQEAVNNNGGAVPANYAAFSDNFKSGLYDKTTDVDYTKQAAAVTVTTAFTDNNKVYVRNFAKCATPTTLDTNPTSRNAVAIYFIEKGSGAPTLQCQDI
ncbi:MAG: hypothetical protein JWN82_635 [Candidatus Saccharibacteria bacterium]|nr:hypothetical protein [Candidatus Saccharibacteria bacterium]